jgi:hypothetical protein
LTPFGVIFAIVMEIHVVEVGHNPLTRIHKCVPKHRKVVQYNTSVVLFFSKNTNVSQKAFLDFFWSAGFYVAHGMRMTVSAVPSREVCRLRRRSPCPRLIQSAHQPAILSSNAERNRS